MIDIGLYDETEESLPDFFIGIKVAVFKHLGNTPEFRQALNISASTWQTKGEIVFSTETGTSWIEVLVFLSPLMTVRHSSGETGYK